MERARSAPFLIAATLAVVAFAPSITGDFVYDDRSQILDNHLIQSPSSFQDALLSDVWAFKGPRDEPWSHYWRPVFVGWLILEGSVFGFESPVGWHLANLALHLLVLWLADRWLLGLGVPPGIRLTTLALFAVHPVHVESITWISGSPDLLMAAFSLGALLLAQTGRDPESDLRRSLGCCGLFLLALLSKEAAIVLPGVVLLQILASPARAREKRLRRAAVFAIPMILSIPAYLAVRIRVLGTFQLETPWTVTALDLAVSLPRVVAFYVRQMVFPATLGPSYPIRVGPGNPGELGLAMLLVGALIAWGFHGLRRDRRIALGLGLFLFLLAPAFNLGAFLPEQIVHDRYLYLPSLGFLLATTLTLRPLAKRLAGPLTTTLVVGAIAGLAILSIRYSQAWTSEAALWERAVRVDPGSAFNLAQLGHVQLENGRHDEALANLDRALAITPVVSALLDRADIRVAAGHFADAEKDLRRVIARQPDNYGAIVRLGRALNHQSRRREAIEVLVAGREKAHHRRCALTSNLAVLFVLEGEGARALRELQSVSDLVGLEPDPACQLVPFHLGTLHRSRGDRDAAAPEYRRFLAETTRSRNEQVLRNRTRAEAWLESEGD